MPKQKAKEKADKKNVVKPKIGKKPQRSAVVVLTIGTERYSGRSSGQYGHAEMEALRKFIISTESDDDDPCSEIRSARSKTVRCPNQPVCRSCTLVLKSLGFKTAGSTKWGTEKSGGVSWGASTKVKEFMNAMGKIDVYNKAISIGKKG